MSDKTASEQIDEIIRLHGGWKSDVLQRLRAIIIAADPNIVEEIKWKMPTRPEGLPVWSRGGIICFAEIWKDNVKLIFFNGAQLTDPTSLFNSRLQSATLRAIELHEGDEIDKEGIKALLTEAVELSNK